jgi:hypothetical protein
MNLHTRLWSRSRNFLLPGSGSSKMVPFHRLRLRNTDQKRATSSYICCSCFSVHYSSGRDEEEAFARCAETPFRMLSRSIDHEIFPRLKEICTVYSCTILLSDCHEGIPTTVTLYGTLINQSISGKIYFLL